MNTEAIAQQAYEQFCGQTMPKHIALKWEDLPPMYREAWKAVVDLVRETGNRADDDMHGPPPGATVRHSEGK